jgi:hypothetical protein
VGLPRPEEIGFINTAHEIGWALRGLGREEAARSYFGVYVARMAAERTQIEAEAALQSDSDGSFSSAFMGGLLGTTCYNLACGHALVGDADSALEALRAATRYGYADTQWATVDPDLDSLDRAALAEALGIGFGTNPASAE